MYYFYFVIMLHNIHHKVFENWFTDVSNLETSSSLYIKNT